MKTRLNLRKVVIGFHHAGLTCPKCGFVFTRGFSDVSGAVPHTNLEGLQRDSQALTVCTRCRTVLRLGAGALSIVSQMDEMLMGPTERENIEVIREALKALELARGIV